MYDSLCIQFGLDRITLNSDALSQQPGHGCVHALYLLHIQILDIIFKHLSLCKFRIVSISIFKIVLYSILILNMYNPNFYIQNCI